MTLDTVTTILATILLTIMFFMSCIVGMVIGAVATGFHLTGRLRAINSQEESRFISHAKILSDSREILNTIRRLQYLKEQSASMGVETPPHIAIEIEDLEEKVSAWLK